MLTVEIEYMDGKIVRYNEYTSWSIDNTGHTLTITNSKGVHIVPLLNVRDVYIYKK